MFAERINENKYTYLMEKRLISIDELGKQIGFFLRVDS